MPQDHQPDHHLGFATAVALAKHWQVNRASVPSIVRRHRVQPSPIHPRPRYAWHDILTIVEGIHEDLLQEAAFRETFMDPLLTTAEVADKLSVSAQTIRNYLRWNALKAIILSPGLIRFDRRRMTDC